MVIYWLRTKCTERQRIVTCLDGTKLHQIVHEVKNIPVASENISWSFCFSMPFTHVAFGKPLLSVMYDKWVLAIGRCMFYCLYFTYTCNMWRIAAARSFRVIELYHGPLARYINLRQECRERFPHHRWLPTPTCITARA